VEISGCGQLGPVALDLTLYRVWLENGEELRTHHVIPKKLGGTDALDNLRLLHLYCHRQIHSNKAPLGVCQLLEPWWGATRSPGS
jgi:hypothetical protein